MSAVVTAYKPTAAARARGRLAGLLVPREIHVHADGEAVAIYDHHGDVHFASLFGLLDHHGLAQRDLDAADPVPIVGSTART
jgi:hypothetical protein